MFIEYESPAYSNFPVLEDAYFARMLTGHRICVQSVGLGVNIIEG